MLSIVLLVTLCVHNCLSAEDFDFDRIFQDKFRSPWPDKCCRLKWQMMKFGDGLPDNYVNTGHYRGSDWAVTKVGKWDIGAKPDQRSHRPYQYCNRYAVCPSSDRFFVLINPYKCEIGWEGARYGGRVSY